MEGVEGEGEVADLARTFNRMADNIQMNDNSRGPFMGNIAHELRTPMTTIKGFVDGICLLYTSAAAAVPDQGGLSGHGGKRWRRR